VQVRQCLKGGTHVRTAKLAETGKDRPVKLSKAQISGKKDQKIKEMSEPAYFV